MLECLTKRKLNHIMEAQPINHGANLSANKFVSASVQHNWCYARPDTWASFVQHCEHRHFQYDPLRAYAALNKHTSAHMQNPEFRIARSLTYAMSSLPSSATRPQLPRRREAGGGFARANIHAAPKRQHAFLQRSVNTVHGCRLETFCLVIRVANDVGIRQSPTNLTETDQTTLYVVAQYSVPVYRNGKEEKPLV